MKSKAELKLKQGEYKEVKKRLYTKEEIDRILEKSRKKETKKVPEITLEPRAGLQNYQKQLFKDKRYEWFKQQQLQTLHQRSQQLGSLSSFRTPTSLKDS